MFFERLFVVFMFHFFYLFYLKIVIFCSTNVHKSCVECRWRVEFALEMEEIFSFKAIQYPSEFMKMDRRFFDNGDTKRCKEGEIFSSKLKNDKKKIISGNFIFPQTFFSPCFFSSKFPLGIVQIKRKWEIAFLSLFSFLIRHPMKWNKKSKFSCSWDVLRRWDCVSKRNRFWGDGKS